MGESDFLRRAEKSDTLSGSGRHRIAPPNALNVLLRVVGLSPFEAPLLCRLEGEPGSCTKNTARVLETCTRHPQATSA